MTLIRIALCIFLPFIGFSQAKLQTANLGDFKTTGGGVIKNCQVGYRTYGKLNSDQSNAILWPTWFTGKSEQLASNAGSLIDTTKYFLITVDALGNGVSSSPSNTKDFPDISIRDMVNSEYRLLTEVLKINHLYAVMGVSMGGMQTFEWVVAYPDFMTKAIPLVGTPKQSFYDNLLWQTEWNIIEQAGKSKSARKEAMKQVAAVHQLHLYTPKHWNDEKTAADVADFIQKTGEDNVKNHDPENWICQIKAMMGHDIYASSGKTLDTIKDLVKAQMLIIVNTEDEMVNPDNSIAFGRKLSFQMLQLTSDCGHVFAPCDNKKMSATVKAFLN